MTLHEAFDAIVDALVAECREHYGERLRAAAVFGSVGRGRMHHESDVDLLVVAEPLPDGRLARMDEFDGVDRAVQPAIAAARAEGVSTWISPIVRTPAELDRSGFLLFDIACDARIVHDPDGWLEGYLAGVRRRLEERGARRHHPSGRTYWKLEPDIRPGQVGDRATGDERARAYLAKAAARRRVLEVLAEQEAWSDVVNKAQEMVEFALEAALMPLGVDAPKGHDVGPVVAENAGAFPDGFRSEIPRMAETSRWLRRERELAFYGDVDAVPTETYDRADAQRAASEALAVLDDVQALLAGRDG